MKILSKKSSPVFESALEALQIPRTLDDAVQRRLSRLSATARDLLTTAALLGRRFDLAVLQQMTGHPDRGLLALIKEALASGLIREARPDRPGSAAPGGSGRCPWAARRR